MNRVLEFIICVCFFVALFIAHYADTEINRLKKEIIQKRNEAMFCGAELLTARANNVELVACIQKENNCDVTMFIGAK